MARAKTTPGMLQKKWNGIDGDGALLDLMPWLSAVHFYRQNLTKRRPDSCWAVLWNRVYAIG